MTLRTFKKKYEEADKAFATACEIVKRMQEAHWPKWGTNPSIEPMIVPGKSVHLQYRSDDATELLFSINKSGKGVAKVGRKIYFGMSLMADINEWVDWVIKEEAAR